MQVFLLKVKLLVALFCNRSGKLIECEVSHPDADSKVEKRSYKIHLDSPPYLMFSADNGSETALINSNKHAASYTSRMIDTGFLGHKVCSMTFLTQDQYSTLNKNDN